MSRAIAILVCLAGLFFGPASAAEPAVTTRALSLCHRASGQMACEPVTRERISLNRPDSVLVLIVDVSPQALRADRPLVVELFALASSEVRWNGALLGHNGRPGADRASERPGRLDADFVVPAQLVRPGRNVVTARVSSHHLWAPVGWPLHLFRVTPYQDPVRTGMTYYLPAIMMLSIFAVTALYFGAAAAIERPRLQAALLSAIACAAMAQMLAEVTRVFVAYSYPWHVVRVGAVAVLSAVVAILIAAYAADRFTPAWRKRVIAAAGVAAIGVLVSAPSYDGKATGSLTVGLLALLGCAIVGARAGRPGAWAAIVVAMTGLGLNTVQVVPFLDVSYYLLAAAVLAALLAAHGVALRRSLQARMAEARAAQRAAAEAALVFKDGARTHTLTARDIRYFRGADDYCEIHLAGGACLLTSTTLNRLQQSLPAQFLRIHKSYIVNTAPALTIAPRPGGGRAVRLADGSALPIGRTYEAAVRRWMAPPSADEPAAPPSAN